MMPETNSSNDALRKISQDPGKKHCKREWQSPKVTQRRVEKTNGNKMAQIDNEKTITIVNNVISFGPS
jgi:hypothetical protein